MSDLASPPRTPAPRAIVIAQSASIAQPDGVDIPVRRHDRRLHGDLNIQITNVLLNIEGGIGTGVDNGS